ncbi:MAG TPA: PilN domain-containing protein [Longimicrobium sp.]|nr:PilN domain-containing protein [Longimicrobium sp.]
MIEINLLPSGAARRPAARRERAAMSLPGADPRVAGLAVATLLLVVLGAFLWWRQSARAGELTGQIERERADSLRLARTIALMKSMESRRDTIEQKMAVIRSVDGRRYQWPHLLDEISRAVPPYTWLTRVAAGARATGPAPAPAPAAPPAGGAAKADSGKAALPPPPPPPSFSVEGNAATTQALTRFMKNLEASAFIRDVALVTSEQTQVQGRSYLKFTLEARWEQPDSTLIETVPVVPVH